MTKPKVPQCVCWKRMAYWKPRSCAVIKQTRCFDRRFKFFQVLMRERSEMVPSLPSCPTTQINSFTVATCPLVLYMELWGWLSSSRWIRLIRAGFHFWENRLWKFCQELNQKNIPEYLRFIVQEPKISKIWKSIAVYLIELGRSNFPRRYFWERVIYHIKNHGCVNTDIAA